MIGNNEMHINQATICEAIRYWLTNAVLKEPVKVTSVQSTGSTGYNGPNEFTVKFEYTQQSTP